MTTTTIDPLAARHWVDRWERQQEHYAVEREERFTVVLDLVEQVVAGRRSPLILDLGAGPGSLAARLADRFPDARIVAVDADPLLLELGRACHGDRLRFVRALAGSPGWIDSLTLSGPVDAVVSTTALHYPPPALLRTIYTDLAAALRPGGILVNADHMPCSDAQATALLQGIAHRRTDRQGLPAENWWSWWAAVEQDPALARALAERRRSPLPEGGNNELSATDHLVLLRETGFRTAAPVWQIGISHIVVGLR